MKLIRGFSMVDIMVGLLIGILVALTAYQALMFFRGYERTGITTNSAVENGVTALYAIEQGLKMSGLGFVANNLIGCSSLNASYAGNLVANNTLIAPVIIQNNGTGPATITIIYGSSIISGAPAQLLTSTSSSAGSLTVNSATAMQANDYALLTNPGSGLPCTLIKITQIQANASNSTVSFTAGNAPATTYPPNSFIIDIGTLNWQTWSINNNVLQNVNNLTGAILTIADNIVQLQAQYGVTNGTTESIQQWVNPTGTWATLTAATIPTIRAIRIAMVARSIQQQKPPVSGGACNTTTQGPILWPGGSPVDLTATPKWQCYRYQVFRTIIPIKNVLYGGVQ